MHSLLALSLLPSVCSLLLMVWNSLAELTYRISEKKIWEEINDEKMCFKSGDGAIELQLCVQGSDRTHRILQRRKKRIWMHFTYISRIITFKRRRKNNFDDEKEKKGMNKQENGVLYWMGSSHSKETHRYGPFIFKSAYTYCWYCYCRCASLTVHR